MTNIFFVLSILVVSGLLALRQPTTVNKAKVFFVGSMSCVLVIFQTPIPQLYFRLDDLVFGAVLISHFLQKPSSPLLAPQYSDRPLVLYVGFATLISLVAYLLFEPSLYTVFMLSSLLKLYICFRLGKTFSGDMQSIYALLAVAGSILVLAGWLQVSGTLEPYEYSAAYREHRAFEITSLLGSNPAHFGLFMTLAFYGAYSYLRGRRHGLGRKRTLIPTSARRSQISFIHMAALVCCFVLFLIGTLLSDSRSSLIALCLSGLLVLLHRRSHTVLVAVCIASGVIVFWSDLQNATLGSRTVSDVVTAWFDEGRLGSAIHRATILSNAMNFIANKPWTLITGIGYGNWLTVLNADAEASSAHNAYLGVLVETGVAGLGFFILLLTRVVGTLRRRNSNEALFFIPFLCVSFFGDFILPMPSLEHFAYLIFFLLGAGLSHAQRFNFAARQTSSVRSEEFALNRA